jgi:hypothetical protein
LVVEPSLGVGRSLVDTRSIYVRMSLGDEG